MSPSRPPTACPGEDSPPRVRADLSLDWPTWSQSAYRSWSIGEPPAEPPELIVEIALRVQRLAAPRSGCGPRRAGRRGPRVRLASPWSESGPMIEQLYEPSSDTPACRDRGRLPGQRPLGRAAPRRSDQARRAGRRACALGRVGAGAPGRSRLGLPPARRGQQPGLSEAARWRPGLRYQGSVSPALHRQGVQGDMRLRAQVGDDLAGSQGPEAARDAKARRGRSRRGRPRRTGRPHLSCRPHAPDRRSRDDGAFPAAQEHAPRAPRVTAAMSPGRSRALERPGQVAGPRVAPGLLLVGEQQVNFSARPSRAGTHRAVRRGRDRTGSGPRNPLWPSRARLHARQRL